ncbi:uncharacterized protein G6M90_00g053790 [Metarhizium brunneum]|uniref:Tse2 ADP-ribosyltransferase toxin domain-containing protein n=1 Tax=Metarhizium brunneum TaxID=500148 RepID=A0A7D5Z1P5_9HYPO|nr:hypothetical protein G6M90_00g053790 [Metarhizium brunneum]
MQACNLIAVFKRFPKHLFRVNTGRPINLRVWSPRRYSYDIFAENGLVKPKALDPLSYAAPNGASMRPHSPYQQSLVSWRFRGSDMIVYSVPKGTLLPDDLVLVHERSDHYSLQPAVAMTVDGKFSCMPFRNCDQSLTRHLDMNARMTNFFRDNAQEFTRDEWLEAYPKSY